MLIPVIVSVLVAGLIYQILKPPAPKICGSANGPPVSSPRIRLRDGRYLAYKTRGADKENAKYKVILTHGFSASKDTYIPLSDSWLQELSISLITFDRPGYVESDPHPNRSPKSDAFDIQELADQLQLGPKIYVIGLSMGAYAVWGLLKYLPHRLAGAALVSPVVNFWWPSLPSELSTKVYRRLPFLEQCRLWLFHHSPQLAWVFHRIFPSPNIDALLKQKPKAFNAKDLVIMKILAEAPAPDKDKITQQGAYESLHRDYAVSYGAWELDPLELSNPFLDGTTLVHHWIGREDGMFDINLQRYVSEKLTWLLRHEIPYGGHLFVHDKNVCEMILKSLVLGEEPSF